MSLDNGELLARKQEALRACGEANESYLKAWWDCHKARRVCYEAKRVYDEAFRVYSSAWRDYEEAGRKEVGDGERPPD